MQGLVYLLAGEENAHSEAWDEPDGPRVAVCVDAPCEEWVRGALELAKAGFVLLAERYPDHVRFADISKRGTQTVPVRWSWRSAMTAAYGKSLPDRS